MISVTQVGAQEPRLVQITVSQTPDGVSWALVGSAAGIAWTVPGGMGIGDGEAINLVDNRTPLNTPAVYTLIAGAGQEESDAVTVSTSGDVDAVIGSLDGQLNLPVQLIEGTELIEMEPAGALFTVPGRRNPVSRYSVTSNPIGKLIVRVPLVDSEYLDRLLAPGGPLLIRLAAPAFDLPLVQVVQITSVSANGNLVGAYRHWSLGYQRVDDPYMDQRLGAFTWDFIDELQAQGAAVVRDGDAMEQMLAGLTWDQIDALDWSVYA